MKILAIDTMRILAIDPGLKGGIAWGNDSVVQTMPMPANDVGLDLGKIVELFLVFEPELIVIEHVQNMPGEDSEGNHTQKNGASAMFRFGQGYGALQGIVMTYRQINLNIPKIFYPTPQQWKRVILPGRTKGKQGAIDYCKTQFPHINLILPGCRKEHDGMADAICLLRYGQKLAERKSE